MKVARFLLALAAVPVAVAVSEDGLPFSFVNVASRAGLTTPTVFGGREENRYLLETILSGVFARA